jgi:surfeit locus 1 family protein
MCFFKPAILIWLAFTFAVFIGLVKLAFWQYDRGIEKDQRVARITELNKEQPLSLSEVVDLSVSDRLSEKALLSKNSNLTTSDKKILSEIPINNKDGINDYPVMITGHFIDEVVFLLDNQVEKGRLGYRVLQVVQTDKYSVLVNLGWVQGSINRNELPVVKPYSDEYSFNGHVRLMDKGIMLMEQDFSNIDWPLRVQQIELDKFSTLLINELPEQVIQPLLPFVIYVDEDEKIGYKKNWHAIVMPAEKHYGYTFQWASLAVAWLLLMGGLAIKTTAKASSTANTSK